MKYLPVASKILHSWKNMMRRKIEEGDVAHFEKSGQNEEGYHYYLYKLIVRVGKWREGEAIFVPVAINTQAHEDMENMYKLWCEQFLSKYP